MCSLLVFVQTETCSGQKMLCDLEHEVKGLLLMGIIVLEIPGTRDVLSLTFAFSISSYWLIKALLVEMRPHWRVLNSFVCSGSGPMTTLPRTHTLSCFYVGIIVLC